MALHFGQDTFTFLVWQQLGLLAWVLFALCWFIYAGLLLQYFQLRQVRLQKSSVKCISELKRLQARWHFIHALVLVAPLVGLLGTIVGLIDIFEIFPQKKGQLDLAAGIRTALMSTYAGLIIAAPAWLLLYSLRAENHQA